MSSPTTRVGSVITRMYLRYCSFRKTMVNGQHSEHEFQAALHPWGSKRSFDEFRRKSGFASMILIVLESLILS